MLDLPLSKARARNELQRLRLTIRRLKEDSTGPQKFGYQTRDRADYFYAALTLAIDGMADETSETPDEAG